MQESFQAGEERQVVDLEPLNYDRIMAHGFPFTHVKRIDVNEPGIDLQGEVEATCVNNGIPIILESWHKHPDWRPELFTFPYIDEHFGELEIACRDLLSREDIDMSMSDYIRQVHPHSFTSTPLSAEYTGVTTPAMITDSTSTPTNDSSQSPVSTPRTILDGSLAPNHISEHQDKALANTLDEPTWTSNPNKRLLYAKDVSCPNEWQEYFMHGNLFPSLAHMRDNDLNSNTGLAAENLMIYIGQAGTWTPAHIDQCGAIGHNIMAWADNGSSSIWFMVKAEDREKAEELWKSFKRPLEYESYFATVEELKHADFPVYVLEQKIGDFVMVPSLSYHQVVNLGRATIKVSWNRLTTNCLKAAINVVLPRYREIARPEGYRIKLVIKSTLEVWTDLLQNQDFKLPLPTDQFCQSYKDILDLFKVIVNEDWIDLDIMGQTTPRFVKPRRLSHASPACCDFCNSDIWNRQFQCRICLNEDGDPYDLCTNCYALGRGCKHRACSIEFVEIFSMKSCRRIYSDAIRAWNESVDLADFPGFSPMTDDWAESVVPFTDRDYSPTSIAYKRQVNQRKHRRYCHLCNNQFSKNFATVECSTCTSMFCESCLYKYHKLWWKNIVGRRDRWKCLCCTSQCHCAECDNKNGVEHQPREEPREEPDKMRILWFNRPDDEPRNRGSIGDNLVCTFFGDKDEHDDDSDGEFVRPALDRYINRRCYATPAHGRPRRGRNAKMPSSAGSRSVTASRTNLTRGKMTLSAFDAMMSTTTERALRFAFDSGLSRTLETFKRQHEANRTYFSDMFRMDAHYASLGTEVRDSFRLDIIEKQRTGSVALTLMAESQLGEVASKMHGKRKRRDSRLSQSPESLDAPINTELDNEDDAEPGTRETIHKSDTCKRMHI